MLRFLLLSVLSAGAMGTVCAESFNAAAIKVNLQTISLRDVEVVFADSFLLIQDRVRRGELRGAQVDAAVRVAWSEALDTAIQDAILDQRADQRRKDIMHYYLERAGQETSGERARDAFKRLESDYVRRLRRELIAAAGGEEELRATLKRRGQSLHDWEAGLSRELFRRDVISVELGPLTCPPSAVAAFYKEHPELFRQDEAWRLRRIRIAKKKFSSAETALEAARIVQDKAQKGTDFAQLAAKVSDDPEFAKSGGLLTKNGHTDLPSGNFSAEEQLAEALKDGEISEPKDIGEHYLIVQRLNHRPADAPPFEKVSERAEALAYAEKLKEGKRQLFEKLKKESYIEILQKDPPAQLLTKISVQRPDFVAPDE